MKLNINDRAALAIKNKTKRVEIRANTNNKNFSKLKVNDIIEFNSNNLGIFYVKVKEVNHYNTIEELLTLEGTRYTLSSTNDFNEAVKSINSINGYKEEIKKSGVYAIHIEYLYSENTVWDELLEKAKSVRNPRDVSGLISAGGVGAAILTKNHNIYTGVCIDTASTLGMCGERNAIANMITHGENEIIKLVCVDSRGNVGSPCGACREYMMQLSKDSKNIEILKDIDSKEIVKLEELLPDWWAYDRV
ncbi:MAG: cytidine deaminase [Bacilli bacterium]|nr:cytidine deaminase [Bacilli bacterium]